LTLSRLINTDSVGKERTRLSKAIVLCIRELAKQSQVTPDAKDQAAYIALALQAIADGIDVSVLAWEKRDYWVKADKFRMEWMWSGQYAAKMKEAVLSDDWATIAGLMPKIAEKFNKIEVSDNHRLGTPWSNAYKLLALHQKL
jgi:ABC-type anion transport system duplicated permease subunit